jgi:hypothetical protein
VFRALKFPAAFLSLHSCRPNNSLSLPFGVARARIHFRSFFMRLVSAAAVAVLAALSACSPGSDKTNPAIATDEARAERETAAPAAGANSFTEAQARDHAVKAGFADVGTLTQAADGTWQGAAMKDGASVTVVVDYQGNVTTQAAAVMPASPASDGATTTPPATTPPQPTH